MSMRLHEAAMTGGIMEAYKTAEIEVITFEEDVITASGVNETTTATCTKNADGSWSYTSEAMNATYRDSDSDKPAICS